VGTDFVPFVTNAAEDTISQNTDATAAEYGATEIVVFSDDAGKSGNGTLTAERVLLIATRNPGKLREFARLFGGLPYRLVDLTGVGVNVVVSETGDTFDENARLKAAGYAQASGMLTLADDSGLEVDALDGEPGVNSARYGGPGLSDEDRVRRLLERMKGVPGYRRQARFRCVIALAGPGVPGGVVTTEGVTEGAIAHEPIGTSGFGYDPVFWLKERAKTMAELTGPQKDEVSHRGKAARKMAGFLRDMA
jgi:XTP/dITP diphosphohydrolase